MDTKNSLRLPQESFCLSDDDEVFLIVNCDNENHEINKIIDTKKYIDDDQGSIEIITEKQDLWGNRLRKKKNAIAKSYLNTKQSKTTLKKDSIKKKVKKLEEKSKVTIQKNKKISNKKNIEPINVPGPFTCNEKLISTSEVCNETFSVCCDYTLHFRANHQKKRRCTKCQVCEKPLRPDDDEEDSPFECALCGLGFDFQEDLDYHQEQHVKKRPYECDVCHKGFVERHGLTAHMRVHTGEKPYECDFCLRRFVQNSHLLTHIRTHTGERPYVCVVCNKGFGQQRGLQNHMRTHTNIRPYKCKFCADAFIEKRNLLVHLKRYHGNSKYYSEDGHGESVSSDEVDSDSF